MIDTSKVGFFPCGDIYIHITQPGTPYIINSHPPHSNGIQTKMEKKNTYTERLESQQRIMYKDRQTRFCFSHQKR